MSQEKTSNIYLLHRGLAILLDIAVVVLFVVIGRQEHEASYVFGDYVMIIMPYLVAFFGLQLLFGKDQRNIKFAAIAGALAVPIAMVIRVVQSQSPVMDTEYGYSVPFFIVTFLFLNAGWILWRFALNRLRPSTKG